MQKKHLILALCMVLLVASVFTFAHAKLADQSVSEEKIIPKSHNQKVTQYLLDKYETNERVSVLVLFEGAFSQNEEDKISRQDYNRVIAKLGNSENNNIKREAFPIGFMAELTKSETLALAKDPAVSSISYDAPMELSMQDVVQITGADNVWDSYLVSRFPDPNGNYASNFTGEGQTVAIIDTGVDFDHPDLASNNILGCNLQCYDTPAGCTRDCQLSDDNGHGTAMAGIAAASGEEGIKGIAPEASIISLKANEPGTNKIYTIDVLMAMHWVIQNKEEYNISVISMSFGSEEPSSRNGHCDAAHNGVADFFRMVSEDHNIALVVASGNNAINNTYDMIDFPSCLSSAIPVSAAGKFTDNHATYANINQVVKLFGISQESQTTSGINTTIASQYWNGSKWGEVAGTSAATPQIAGAIAIMNQIMVQQGDPEKYNPKELETMLYENGDPVNNILGNHRDVKRINVENTVMKGMQECSLGGSGINPQWLCLSRNRI